MFIEKMTDSPVFGKGVRFAKPEPEGGPSGGVKDIATSSASTTQPTRPIHYFMRIGFDGKIQPVWFHTSKSEHLFMMKKFETDGKLREAYGLQEKPSWDEMMAAMRKYNDKCLRAEFKLPETATEEELQVTIDSNPDNKLIYNYGPVSRLRNLYRFPESIPDKDILDVLREEINIDNQAPVFPFWSEAERRKVKDAYVNLFWWVHSMGGDFRFHDTSEILGHH